MVPKKSTMNAVLILKLLMKKNQKGQKHLHCAFDLDLENDRVSRKEL